MLNKISTSFSFHLSVLLFFMSATCVRPRLWCKRHCSEMFLICEVANYLVELLVARCVLVWSSQETIFTVLLCGLLEDCRGAILNSLSLSHPSVPGPPSLQPSVQLLSLCWPLCLQAWTIAGEKVPPPASVQCPPVPEIPPRGWKIAPVRYSASFPGSPYLLFSPCTAQGDLKYRCANLLETSHPGQMDRRS